MPTPPLDPYLARAAHEAVKHHGTQSAAAKALGISRTTLQSRLDRYIPDPIPETRTPWRAEDRIDDGVMIVGSDAHYWPGLVSVAHLAMVALIRKLKPAIVVANGDMLDGCSISRHDPNGWEDRPGLIGELTACTDRLGEIERVSKGARLYWTQGNHDQRFERYLAMRVPEFRDVRGFKLPDHFPRWRHTISLLINGDVMVKHRLRNGVHAAHNNTVNAGISTVTGHLHSLKVTPFSDYRGTRFGVDTGTLADPDGPQFTYDEDGPKNHRSGFAVLTFRGGKLLPPELCVVVDGVPFFRGAEVAI